MKSDMTSEIPCGEPETAEELTLLLRSLRARRASKNEAHRRLGRRRRHLSTVERRDILAKTAGRCHICGGLLAEAWQADHVLAHSSGGTEADNYLPAHMLCNNYRWDYLSEEFQLILKLGVWTRTQIEKGTALGQQVASAFVAYEKARRRRKSST